MTRAGDPDAGARAAAAPWRENGLRFELLEAFLDVLGEVAAHEQRAEADERAARTGFVTFAPALLAAIAHPGLLERIELLEARMFDALLVSPAFGPGTAAPAVEWSPRRLAREGGSPLARCEARAPRVGAARIGGLAVIRQLAEAHDLARLRATGEWRRLPVGCIVHGMAAPDVLAVIGDSHVEAGSAAPGEPARRNERQPTGAAALLQAAVAP